MYFGNFQWLLEMNHHGWLPSRNHLEMFCNDHWEKGNSQQVGWRLGKLFCFGCFLFLFFTPVFSEEWDLVSCQNLTTSKICGWKSSAVIANVKSNLSFALERLDSKDSWSVAIFYFKWKSQLRVTIETTNLIIRSFVHWIKVIISLSSLCSHRSPKYWHEFGPRWRDLLSFPKWLQCTDQPTQGRK